MKGCLFWLFGLIVGVALVLLAQIILIKPPPIRPSSPAQSDIVILFRNEFLTRLLREQAAQLELPVLVEGLTVQAAPGDQLIVDGTATAAVFGRSITTPLRLTVRPTIQDDRVKFQIMGTEVGGLTLPDEFSPVFDRAINQQLSQALAGASFRVVGVDTTIEGMVIEVTQIREF